MPWFAHPNHWEGIPDIRIVLGMLVNDSIEASM